MVIGKRSDQKGFNLLELLIAVITIAIIATLGMPSLQTAIRDSRMTTQLNDLATDINIARNEAITRGMEVVLCRRNTAGSDCNYSDGDDNGNWEDGWIIYINHPGSADSGFNNPNDDTPCHEDSYGNLDEDCLIKIHEPMENNTLRYPRSRIVFNARGFASGYNGTFTLCDERGDEEARAKTLANSGRLSDGSPDDCP